VIPIPNWITYLRSKLTCRIIDLRAAGTWVTAASATEMKSLKCLRQIIDTRWYQRVTNADIRSLTGLSSLAEHITDDFPTYCTTHHSLSGRQCWSLFCRPTSNWHVESEAHCADTVYLLGYVLYVNHLQADLINCTSYIFRIT